MSNTMDVNRLTRDKVMADLLEAIETPSIDATSVMEEALAFFKANPPTDENRWLTALAEELLYEGFDSASAFVRRQAAKP